jgi:multidrug efflux system membrane fusion protein
VITQMQPATVVFAVPQDFIPQFVARFKAAQVAKTNLVVEAWDRENRRLLVKGYLDSIDNQIDTSTGTVKMRAVFPNEDDSLFANQFVNVRTVLEVIPDALIIPTSGVQNGSMGTFAYVVADDKTVKVRKLELGTTNGGRVAIVSGLSIGERVVIDGADKLREGIKVEVGEAAPGKRRGTGGKGGNGKGPGAPAEASSTPAATK